MCARKVQWDMGDDPGDEALSGGDVYAGDTPPAGVYRWKVIAINQAKIKASGANAGKPRLGFRLQIDETRPDRKQYNGYRTWNNQNVTQEDVARRILKQITYALGVEWE